MRRLDGWGRGGHQAEAFLTCSPTSSPHPCRIGVSLGQADLPLTTSFWLTVSGGKRKLSVGTESPALSEGGRSRQQVGREYRAGTQRVPAVQRLGWGWCSWNGGGGSCPCSPAPDPPLVPSLTLIFLDVPPAGHPAVIPVLEFSRRGQDTDRLDIRTVGDSRGQLQHGNVIR